MRSGRLHSDDMACPSKLGFQDHGLNARRLGSVKDLQVCDLVLPPDAKDGSEAAHVKTFQHFDVFAVEGPSLASIKEAGKDDKQNK